MSEKQLKGSNKKLRIDGRKEFNLTKFKRFYEQEGIGHEIIVPYTPQHNRVAKRRNKTIINIMKAMLKSKSILNYF